MMESAPGVFSSEQHAVLIRHYELVAPLIAESFAGTPFVSGFVPDWSTKAMVFEGRVASAPAAIATIDVALKVGVNAA